MDTLKYCAYELLTLSVQKILLMYQYLIQFLNSDFGTAAVGSFFGAVGGYFMVILTNRRNKTFERVKALRIASAFSHMLFNTSFGLYKQQVKDLFEEYETGRKKFIETHEKFKKGEKVEIAVQFNFKKIIFPPTDLDFMNSRFEKADLSGRSLILATTLMNSFATLKSMMEIREQILANINSIKSSQEHKAFIYYGVQFPHPAGNIQEESYKNIMEGIKSFNEDCIWFSKELSEEILYLAKKESKKIWLKKPKVGSIDYSDVDPLLLPDDENYKDWREKFVRID